MFSFGMAMQSAFAFVVALFIACVFIVSVEESYKIGKWESAGLFIMMLVLIYLLLYYVQFLHRNKN